jgi:hypothetical protein
MTDPQPLAAGFAGLTKAFPPEHRLHQIAASVITASSECAERRARVLKHPDLAKRLTEPPLGYSDPAHWNGWVPPRLTDPGSTGESLLMPRLDRGGGISYRFNQLGHRTTGEQVNDSPRRAALVDIAAEALRREQDDAP